MISEDVIADLKAKHGDIFLLTAGDVEVVVKRPTRAIWRKFRTLAADPAKRADCVEGLFRDCAVFPDAKEIEALLSLRPALAEVFGGEVCEIAGANEEASKNVL